MARRMVEVPENQRVDGLRWVYVNEPDQQEGKMPEQERNEHEAVASGTVDALRERFGDGSERDRGRVIANLLRGAQEQPSHRWPSYRLTEADVEFLLRALARCCRQDGGPCWCGRHNGSTRQPDHDWRAAIVRLTAQMNAQDVALAAIDARIGDRLERMDRRLDALETRARRRSE